jgi:hypothetical protein
MGLLGGFATGNREAGAQRDAAEDYIKFQKKQQKQFLNAPQNLAARKTLSQYMQGETGYDPDTLAAMQQGVTEDYGRGQRDYVRNIGKTGVRPGGGYTPGRRARSERLVSENMGTRRAEALRAIRENNANLGLENQRWAFSQNPTYSKGMPQAVSNIGYQVFRDKNAQGPNWMELLGGVGDIYANMGLGAMAGMPGTVGSAGQAGMQSYNNPSFGRSGRYNA